MELRHLRYLLAVADGQSVRQASERLHVTQPAISRQIQDLEAELGTLLFARSPRGLTLTAAGQAYVQEVRRIMASLESAAKTAKALAQGSAGSIRLGYVENAGWDGLLPLTFKNFRAELPGVGTELTTLNSPEQVRAIEDGSLDGGFIYQYGPVADGLLTLPLLEHDVVLAVPRSWDMGPMDKASTDIASLAGRPFVMFPRAVYPAYHDRLIDACQRRGLTPNIVHEASSEATILSLVCSGIGAAIVNAANLGRPPAQVRFFALNDLSIPMPLVFAYPRASGNPVLPRFIATLRASLEQMAETPAGHG